MIAAWRAALLAATFVLLCAVSALAQAPAQAPAQVPGQDAKAKAPPAVAEPAPKKAEEATGKKTPVSIDHDDSDPVGVRLAYRVKELLGRSSLMVPTNRDEKKIVLVIKTKEEFPGRPNLCSIYSVSWLFSSREGSLKYFLASEAGIVDASNVDQAAEALLGRTDKLASTYGYLF
ncbi:hypothetical protein DVDV_2727 [Desulfovibrio sp. DV]|uniref:hypothetical protein n=1 Tax=Desulfovibrio sp. DV TaxID=1844708 RepID=UPI00094B812F|nr:hypothetical protein [Desulfovibrio sp. DV]OLN26327.1 hypothetical protein DVDV_2727 [Desulfovibrio sp. DV]